jgi:CRISPR system Cascade subunit CasD
MSFGGVRVDETNPTDGFPGQSMLTGLVGNALGICHGEFDVLSELQTSIVQGSRIDVPGQRLVDYQTVDLGQRFMKSGWTTWGKAESREGGKSAREGTHQRWRHYWADRVVTVALTVKSGASIGLDQLQGALRAPARTLFIGRKPCLPATRILQASIEAENVLSALQAVPLSTRCTQSTVMAQWPVHDGSGHGARITRVTDERDWSNQIHVGRRKVYQGELTIDAREGETA